MVTVTGLALSLIWIIPQLGQKSVLQVGQEMRLELERRQLVLEALDKMARYQKHFNEIHGRYARDLHRLSLPDHFSTGTRELLDRSYELSVLEARPNRFLLMASGIGNSDRVTIDESHRINANFVLPVPSRAYLLEEADRLLRLKMNGKAATDGIVSRYWSLKRADNAAWVAVGLRNPVLGERRAPPEDTGGLASLFSVVREKVTKGLQGRELAQVSANGLKETLTPDDVNEWLRAAHLAQHIHLKERGAYASRWEDLDTASNYGFSERMKAVRNLRVYPIELTREGFLLTLEGTSGDLHGEQFTVNQTGELRQVRYTETLIQQLKETTEILENFQINPITDEPGYRP